MEVSRIAPGLWRWTAQHRDWGADVGCVYCETEDGPVLVDPLVPPEDQERFWAALDRDVERVGGDVHVLLTVFWHVRSTAAVVERYGARTWAPTAARAAVERRSVTVTDPFRPGDRLPGGIAACATARRNEVVFWIPAHRALAPGDVVLGDDGGGVRLCPKSWLPAGTTLQALARSLRPLLELPVERILVSHGEPVLERGLDALAEALGRP